MADEPKIQKPKEPPFCPEWSLIFGAKTRCLGEECAHYYLIQFDDGKDMIEGTCDRKALALLIQDLSSVFEDLVEVLGSNIGELKKIAEFSSELDDMHTDDADYIR